MARYACRPIPPRPEGRGFSGFPVTQQFLLQFLAIQRKSVGEFGDLLARIGLVKGDNAGILQIDKELGES